MAKRPKQQEDLSESRATIEGGHGFPEPRELLREAEKEAGYNDMKSYAGVIAALRKKGFSFREIAEWLSARGVPTNHNAVYRVFTTCLGRGEAEDIEEGLQND